MAGKRIVFESALTYALLGAGLCLGGVAGSGHDVATTNGNRPQMCMVVAHGRGVLTKIVVTRFSISGVYAVERIVETEGELCCAKPVGRKLGSV